MAVTGAAGLEDRYEARMIDPDMIPEQALARPGEPGTKFDQGATEGQKVVDSMKWTGS
jgi:hypothetical protein